jgi:two-component system, OmpR family, response regulator
MNMRNLTEAKILIVDDESDARFLFERILGKRNLKSAFARNLTEATNAMEMDHPSLIFLDNSLPDGRGIDFIPFLKEHYPGTRVIIITANDNIFDKKIAFQKGADDFLSKPLSLELINRTLDDMPSINRSV